MGSSVNFICCVGVNSGAKSRGTSGGLGQECEDSKCKSKKKEG